MLTLSMSAVQAYQRCPKKFSIQYLMGYEDAREEKEALAQGTSIHKLLELAAKGLPWEDHGSMNEVAACYLQHNPLPDGIISADDPQYVELTDLNVRLRTTFDLVYVEGDMLVVRDYKTFDRAPSLDVERNFQARCYLWAATQIWPGFEVYKFEHEYIRRTPPFVPKDQKKNVWFPKDCYIRSTLVLRGDSLVEDAEEIQEWVKEILRSIEHSDRWKRVYLNGGGYDGCNSCSVKNLCFAQSQGELDPQTLQLIGQKTDRSIFDVTV